MDKKIKLIIGILIIGILIAGGWWVWKSYFSSEKEVVFSTGCTDIADLWTNLPQDKKIEECNKILNQRAANLKNFGVEPKDCEVIKAEAKHCTEMLGTQLVCTYSCKKYHYEITFAVRKLEIAKDFVSNEVGDDWIILENSSQIPYQESDKKDPKHEIQEGKDPKDYEDIVKPYTNETSSNTSLVTLYTWSKFEGGLVEWEITIRDGRVTHQYAKVIALSVGHYTPAPLEGSHLPEPGRVLVDSDVKNKQ